MKAYQRPRKPCADCGITIEARFVRCKPCSNRSRVRSAADGHKVCGKCALELPLEAFQPEKRGFRGRRSTCRACCTTARREWARRTGYRASREENRKRNTSREARLRQQFVELVDPAVLLARDRGLCGICGRLVDPAAFDVDHVIPLSRGGEHSYANTQPSHPTCNRSKGARMLRDTGQSVADHMVSIGQAQPFHP